MDVAVYEDLIYEIPEGCCDVTCITVDSAVRNLSLLMTREYSIIFEHGRPRIAF